MFNLLHAAAEGLNVIVLEGEGAFNNIQRRLGRDVRVEVRDERGNPVAGASVTFALPAIGPGGTFSKSETTFRTRTDAMGQAATSGLTPNATEGRFHIRITAESDGRTGTATVAQSNTLAGGVGGPNGGRGRKAVLLTILAGAAAGGVMFVTRSGGNDSGSGGGASTPLSLSIGSVTVGGGR